MNALISPIRFLLLYFCLTTVLANGVRGLNCYQCLETKLDFRLHGGEVSQVPKHETCNVILRKGQTVNCTEGTTHCLKFDGVAFGEKQMFRDCAKPTLSRVLPEGCSNATRLADLVFSIGVRKQNPESGTVCICNSEKCNSGTLNVMSLGILLFSLVGMFLVIS